MSKGGFIAFRDQQDSNTVANDDFVKVFAPNWVKNTLVKLARKLKGAKFQIGSAKGKTYTIKDKLTLVDLVAIARNERANTSGIIRFKQYKGIDRKTVIALRDLAKHCVIVGKDIATHFGGYPADSEIQELNQEVYICDLPGLQFQQLDNTGRHVFIAKDNDLPTGDLDKEIYESTVGETKPTYRTAQQNRAGRFIKGNFKGKDGYFDTKAFQAFVAQDFVLAASALNLQAKRSSNIDTLNFKFLKYGAGFFADGLEGDARDKLSENLTKGVLQGLKQWLKLPLKARDRIKRIELPFYKEEGNIAIDRVLSEIQKICQRNQIEFGTANRDALAPTSRKFTTATTNCSDPHAPTGNEMNYGSVDAAIAENLAQKGNNFSPICNKKMKHQFVKVKHLSASQRSENTGFFQTVGSMLLDMKWSALMALSASYLVRCGYGIRLGLSAIGGGVVTFVAVELLRAGRNFFKNIQYQEYASKSQQEINALNDTQKAAFAMGVEAAKSYKGFGQGLFAWEAYREPKAYYAGFEAQQEKDNQLINKINTVRARV